MLTAATVSTLAENYGIYIAGTQVTSSNCNDLTVLDKVQPYSASVNSGKAYAKYDANSKTLTLRNVRIETDDKFCVSNTGVEGLKIVLQGENRFLAKNERTFKFEKKTTITGEEYYGKKMAYILSQYDDCVYVKSKILLTISGASLNLTSHDCCFEGDNNYPTLSIVDSEITAKATGSDNDDCYALKSFGRLSLDNSTVSLTGHEKAVSSLLFIAPQHSYDYLTPDNPGLGYGNYEYQASIVRFYALDENNNKSYDPKTIIFKKSMTLADLPDLNFRNALYNNVEQAAEGILTIDELSRQITSLDVSNQGISDLTGIERFTALTSLDCHSNDLTTLDVSQNKNLTYLNCFSNKLTSLTIPTNSKLTYLDTHDNSIGWPNMNVIVSNLPTANGEMRACSFDDGNLMSKQQVTALKNKGWRVRWYDGYGLVDYDGDSGVEIDKTNFPDDNFREIVSSASKNIDRNQDGYLSSFELGHVYDLDVSCRGIKDLTGIEHFTKLQYLECHTNELTSLDLSKNTALIQLRCGANNLSSLDFSNSTELQEVECGNNPNLTSLNVSNNTKLMWLYCDFCDIQSLDLSKNTELRRLSCDQNALSSLDLSKNTKLVSVSCSENGMKTLNVSNCKLITGLHCEENDLATLDLSDCKELTELDCYDNGIESLNLSKNTKLGTLNIYNNKLSTLNVSKNLEIDWISFFGNQFDVLGMYTLVNSLPTVESGYFIVYSDDVADDNVITTDQVDIANGKGWRVLKLGGNGWNDWVECAGTECEEINPTNFPDKNFRDFLLAQDYGKDGYLITEEIDAIKMLDVSEKGIQDLTGLKYFTALEELNCSSNSLQSLNVMNNRALKKLNVFDNSLSRLNLEFNTELEELNCMNNKNENGEYTLTRLDVSKNTKLKNLNCDGSALTSLDVSNNTQLQVLRCTYNKLTSLDVSKNTKLTYLQCWHNQIKGVGMEQLVNSLPNVESGIFVVIEDQPVRPQDNFITKGQVNIAKSKGWRVTQINIPFPMVDYDGEDVGVAINETNFPDANFRSYLVSASFNNKDHDVNYLSEDELKAATTLNVGNRSIKNLKGIEHFRWLKELNCSNNSLGSLDVTYNSALTTLNCHSTGLTSLDVTLNKELTTLTCYDNPLTSLDVSYNSALTTLDCHSNNLTSLDVTKNTELKVLKCHNNSLTSLNPYCNTKLETLWCYGNQINISSMYMLVTNLRTFTSGNGIFRVVKSSSSGTDNIITTAQVTTATNKGWKVQNENGNTYAGNNTSIPINDANFPDKNFSDFLKSQSYGADLSLSIEELAEVKSLLMDQKDIGDLTGIEYFTELTSLYVNKNSLTTLNISNNKKLQYLYCAENQLTSLDVSNNPELKDLSCRDNNLTSLDVSNHAVLNIINCSGNSLTSLDVSNCPALTSLTCHSNKIRGAAMDNLVNALPTVPSGKKGNLYVNNAQISPDLDNVISTSQVAVAKDKNWNVRIQKSSTSYEDYAGAIEISSTNFPDGKFRTIVSGKDVDSYQDGYLIYQELKAVTELQVSGQGIWSLEGIENFTELTSLDCSNNILTSLDVSKLEKLTKLTKLYCNDNNLSELKLYYNNKLTELNCSNNSLTKLYIGFGLYSDNSSKITNLDCSGNQLDETIMNHVVNTLSTAGGVLYVRNDECSPENIITAAQVTTIRDKGWSVKKYDGNGQVLDYAGQGDIYGDNKIDEKDRDTLVNIIMGQRPANIGTYAGDLNNDQKTDAADVVIMTNILNNK